MIILKKLVIQGGKELSGTINISGAKNSVVALIPASILTKGKCVIHNVPQISDVEALMNIMKFLGSDIKYDIEQGNIKIKWERGQELDEEKG